MKRIMQLVLAATLFSGPAMLTSCSMADNPIEEWREDDILEDAKELAKEAVGTWRADTKESGTLASGEAYARIVQTLTLNADGTGYGATVFLDSENQVVKMYGGQDIAPFNYQVDDKGNIILNFTKGYEPDEERFKALSYLYSDGHVTVTDNGKAVEMWKASEDEADEVLQWDEKMNGGDDNDYKEQKSIIENEGTLYTYEHSFRLNNYIDKYGPSGTEDWLDASGSISLDLRVVPLYVQSSNGDKAGDYYFVKCAVTPHNNSLWKPYKENHAWAQIRIYGYWFKDMDVEVKLVNEDGSDVEGLQYFQRPLPENKNDSKTYTNGTSTTIGATASGGWTKQPGKGFQIGVSFSHTWTSSTSYSLETVNFTRDSSSPTVKYNYYTENVKLSDNWDNKEENFPSACHKEFSGNTCWIWFVPNGKSGVKDGSTNRFRIKANVKAHFSSWYHWRAAVEYDSNRKDYEQKFDTDYLLGIPNRTPWGVIALKNASNSEMAHVSFFKQGDDIKGDPIAKLTNSYSKKEVAKQALTEGTYTVVYDLIDGDSNKKLSTWKVENVKVHQGKDEASATTEISTVDAVEVK